jgi:alanine dehydrogenase
MRIGVPKETKQEEYRVAVTQATLPYILKIVRQGISGIIQDPGFSKAVNTYRGWITHPAIAQAWQELNRYQPLEAIA